MRRSDSNETARQPQTSFAEDVPNKGIRPPFFDSQPSRYQWYFRLLPLWIRDRGQTIPNPFRERAMYLIHGIGGQRDTETATALRLGFEDAVKIVEPEHWIAGAPDNWIVPQPYIYEYFWGDYERIEKHEKELFEQLTPREKEFFKRVWAQRSISSTRTVRWFFVAGLSLIRRARGMVRLYYLYLVPMLWLIVLLSLLLPRTRRYITDYLNDIRLYLFPQGDVELSIVQHIDRTAAERYLGMLGLAGDFTTSKEPLYISNQQPHVFQRITWVAHSLGSVISYNVIGDLLRRCLQVSLAGGPEAENARRVEESLESFVTFGSPLDKVRFLYPGVLRDWPEEYLPGGDRSLWDRPGRSPAFWHNFHYTSDPVSGRLDSFETQEHDLERRRSLVVNWHTAGIRMPGLSHLGYWRDNAILSRVLYLTFAPYVNDVSVKIRSAFTQRVNLILGAMFWALVVPFSLVLLAYWIYRTYSPF